MVEKTFRVSSALKNIIGQDLITNEFIAVFELVKNSFDAHAKQVDIIFKDLKTSSPKLIIQDNGKGMDLHDLENKWLFVAYSAKKDGTEDYRDSIQSTRIHAGAKGIGRFSCDRLGKSLRIYTKKKAAEKTNVLSVKWEAFEQDAHEEFEEVGVSYEAMASPPYNLARGTVLEINDLRENWGQERILKLRRSLEKLVNPNQENDSDNFAINLYAPDFEESDKRVDQDKPWNKINGPVENFLFEKIGLKTTFINVAISGDGEKIKTRLEDRGTLIFELTERNPYKGGDFILHDIEISLFALNQKAKLAFTKHMGLAPVKFGSVFVYKNGFRINPMGDVGHDSFHLDRRKIQGSSRFLGSRDVFGRVDIRGKNPKFQEASSRDGGLVTNIATELLQEFFVERVLKRLEAYAVDIVKYGNLGADFDSALQKGTDIKSKIIVLVQRLTNSDEILDIQWNPYAVDIFEELSEKSIQGLLRNFKQIASRSSSKEIENEIIRAEARLVELDDMKREAEVETEKARKESLEAQKKAKEAEEAQRKAEAEAEKARAKEAAASDKAEKATSENLFLRTVVNDDIVEIKSFHHHIGIAALTIENYISGLSKRIRKGDSFTQKTVLEALENISFQAKKILSTSRFATKANFVLEGSTVTRDLCEYIEEYLLNICYGVIKTNKTADMHFMWENPSDKRFILNFRPLEISIILDNLISNAKKADASSVQVRVLDSHEATLRIQFSNNGKKLKLSEKDRIFDVGYTTTSGSGLGLTQTRSLLREMNGEIFLNETFEQGGAAFILEFTK